MFSGLSGADIVVFLGSLILALSIHEATHGYVAHWLGDTTAYEMGRLTLNPLKHIDLLTTILLPTVMIISGLPPILIAKPVPFNPARVKYDEFGAALIGVAGPLTNLLLAVLGAAVFRFFAADVGSLLHNAIIIFVEVNIGLFVFNMIPFPPLDGSRLLYAFAPEPLQDLMRQIEAAGFIPLIFFMLIIFQFASGPIISIDNALLNFLLA
jgi:Zn-dependent protease